MAAHLRAAEASGLAAVLLITRRLGPRLVFHYPEKSDVKTTSHLHNTWDDSDSESEGINQRDGNDAHGSKGPASIEQVCGYTVESLEKLLSVGRWCNGKKFEVCVNGLTFLGHPVYAFDDGDWSEKAGKQQVVHDNAQIHTTEPAQKAMAKYGDYHMYLDPGSLGNTPPQASPRAANGIRGMQRDFTHVPESLDSQTGQTLAMSVESNSTTSGVTHEHMTMFHVVFVLRSPGSERTQKEVKNMYNEGARKLTMALLHCQRQSNYVSVQSRQLLALRAKAKQSRLDATTLWAQMIETSELAWAIKQVYEGFSAGAVADVRLNGMEMSLLARARQNSHEDEDGYELEPISALLLLEGKESLLHQLSQPDAAPLAHFVREHTPTRNLQKHARDLGMSLDETMFLALHLIKWRKARIITPLHQRNTYVVSPDAPLNKLPELAAGYTKQFPTLPNLPNMVKVLSGKAMKFGNLVPSRDHRGVYMDILGWMVRERLVVQIKTYGWLRLPKDLSVSPELETIDTLRKPLTVRSLLSPRLRAIDDDTASVSSSRTAVPMQTTAMKASNRLSTGTQRSVHSQPHSTREAKADSFTIVTNPTEASEEEARLIAGLTDSLRNPEFRESLPAILCHLDGEHPFEEIAAREGLKRAKLEDWLSELERKGWLMAVRYL